MIKRSHLYEGGRKVLGQGSCPGKEEFGWLKKLKETLHEWLGQEPHGGWEERQLEGQVGGGNTGPDSLWQKIWMLFQIQWEAIKGLLKEVETNKIEILKSPLSMWGGEWVGSGDK